VSGVDGPGIGESDPAVDGRSGDWWRMLLGSCLDSTFGLATLGDKSIDVTITDPPYEAEAHTKQRRQKGATRVAGGNQEFREVRNAALKFASITADERSAAAAQIARVTKHRALVFCQAEAIAAWRDAFNSAGMPYRRAIPWVKPDAMPSLHGKWPGQAWEAIVVAQHTGAPPPPCGGKAIYFKNGYYEFSRERGKQPHETTKPLELMRAIVEEFTDPGELVLDAFAGSGTTGVACRMHGRRFVGWELAPCAQCTATARWFCKWKDGKRNEQSAFLCNEHRDGAMDRDAFESVPDNYFEIACRRLAGDEVRSNPMQLSLLGAA